MIPNDEQNDRQPAIGIKNNVSYTRLTAISPWLDFASNSIKSIFNSTAAELQSLKSKNEK